MKQTRDARLETRDLGWALEKGKHMKALSILGSTGSIGTQTLEIVRNNKSEFKVEALAANSNIDLLEAQVREFRPKVTAIGDESKYEELKQRVRGLTEITAGLEGVVNAATAESCDTVVSAIVGIAGLIPTYKAIKAGKNIALANKETLVTAGRIITEEVKKNRVRMLPVDSEHSAIFQALHGEDRKNAYKILLTASGGPFFQEPQNLQKVTVKEALQHPNWSMGGKITIDSATLMNKGLEVIEAHWLFDLKYDQIEVIIHPQSIIHSMVKFKDGSVLAHMAPADMRLPIQYALTYPDMQHDTTLPLDLLSLKPLTFAQHDPVRFPCLNLAYHAGKIGGSMPTVLNAANEVAVDLFLEEKIGFTDIPQIITSVVNKHQPINQPTLNQLFNVDEQARKTAVYDASQLIERND